MEEIKALKKSLKKIKREIVFDGVKFWYKDKPIGTIREDFRFQSPIPKEVMDSEKYKLLGRIIG